MDEPSVANAKQGDASHAAFTAAPVSQVQAGASAETPLVQDTVAEVLTEQGPPSVWAHSMKTLILGTIYIIISSALIDFNKYMMTPGNFPFALPLVTVHSVTSVACSGFLYLVRPSLFPSLVDPEKKMVFDSHFYSRGALPIALTMVGSLVLSNMAYTWSSVAFLQMMKESNVVLVYFFALAASLESFDWQNMQVLILIVGATLLSVEGEAHFVWLGFFVQGTAQVCECLKITFASKLFSKQKLDPLTFLLVVMPVCCAALFFALGWIAFIGLLGFSVPHLTLPAFADFQRNWGLLLVNALLAFSLNVVVAAFMKHTSPVSVILVGITKDVVIVFFNVMFMHESITQTQTVGFVMQLVFVGLWSAMKTFPKHFEAGIVPAVLGFSRQCLSPGCLPVSSKGPDIQRLIRSAKERCPQWRQ